MEIPHDSFEEEYKMLQHRPQNFDIIRPLLTRRDKSFEGYNKIIFMTTHPQFGQIIVKIDCSKDSFDEIVHEAFIGLYGLNKLGSPYFAKVLDAYMSQECPKYYKLCNTTCNYVIYEYIPGITLLEALKTMMVKEFKEIILQIWLALYDAYQVLQFTHYDLHPGNIIISRTESNHPVIFRNQLLLYSNLLPVIIDYGSSHINIDGVDYGRNFDDGKIHNIVFWPHDIFKLLSMIYDQTRFTVVKTRIEQKLSDKLNEAPGESAYTTDEYIKDIQSQIDETIDIIHDLECTQENTDEAKEELIYLQKELKYVQRYKNEAIQEAKKSLHEAEKRYSTNEKIADITEQLLRFFDPNFNDIRHMEYREEHPYFELDYTENLSFTDFINYSIPILT